MNTEVKKAIIYCRVSSPEQVEGTSLESQERMCREYAKREGISALEVFIDRGESAKTADRTEFIKAISFCSQKKNEVKTTIKNSTTLIHYKLFQIVRIKVSIVALCLKFLQKS